MQVISCSRTAFASLQPIFDLRGRRRRDVHTVMLAQAIQMTAQRLQIARVLVAALELRRVRENVFSTFPGLAGLYAARVRALASLISIREQLLGLFVDRVEIDYRVRRPLLCERLTFSRRASQCGLGIRLRESKAPALRPPTLS